MKKIIISLILCCLMISCGKKGDPVYKQSKTKYKLEKQSTFINKI